MEIVKKYIPIQDLEVYKLSESCLDWVGISIGV
jgi:hypothetical protein